MALLWEREEALNTQERARGTVWRRVEVRMGGVGGVTGKVQRGSEAEAFAWWRSGCLGWSLRGDRIVDVSAASSAPSSCRVVVGRKQKQVRSRQVDMPAATIVLAHPTIRRPG